MTDLGRATELRAGAVGEPGARRFYLKVDTADGAHWFLLEKQQVAALAERSRELLRSLGHVIQDEAPETPLDDPGDHVMFRVGQMALSHTPGSDTFGVVLMPTDEELDGVEFEIDAAGLAAMIPAAEAAVAAGRPLCPRCNLPIDPDGHVCPALNGDLRHPR